MHINANLFTFASTRDVYFKLVAILSELKMFDDDDEAIPELIDPSTKSVPVTIITGYLGELVVVGVPAGVMNQYVI